MNESIQNRLIPTGGTANQFLTRQSDDPNTFDWTTLHAGQGLLLENGTFTIPDYGIYFGLLDQDIQANFFANPIDNFLAAHLDPTIQYDFFSDRPGIDFNKTIVPRDTTNLWYNAQTNGIISQREFPVMDATSQYGTASAKNVIYRPTVSGTTITHLRATDGHDALPDKDITLDQAIPGVDGELTSLVYLHHVERFYFLNNNRVLYSIQLNGSVSRVQITTPFKIPVGSTM